jgi:hypothetical protein
VRRLIELVPVAVATVPVWTRPIAVAAGPRLLATIGTAWWRELMPRIAAAGRRIALRTALSRCRAISRSDLSLPAGVAVPAKAVPSRARLVGAAVRTEPLICSATLCRVACVGRPIVGASAGTVDHALLCRGFLIERPLRERRMILREEMLVIRTCCTRNTRR